ncbi:MAG: phosphate signaling complex protein PhoU [Candidatus Tectomicrobia bacterium]|uniref:Phosphate-specific transport system accessory protein PhoU n=1 Tax=Tectimicrobiota bacterium TaxID=2528274 RepID=A0A937VZH4_UNCTE|nr:phosphate signaling complex protein PhoU [Candidatus Tectomicrobia bacterium]
MSQHFIREIETLKKKILAVGAAVEERISQAITAVVRRDARLAQQVTEGDDEIDEMEVEVEEDCLKILALYQPVAIDLRFVVAVLKMNNDLERMADTAVNIARRAEYLASHPQVDLPHSLMDMTYKVQNMVKQSLDALVQSDPDLARKVCVADREVDQLNKDMHVRVQEEIRMHPDQVERLIHTLSISRHLERIGDLATNVAEDVIYTVEGEIVRHRTLAYS